MGSLGASGFIFRREHRVLGSNPHARVHVQPVAVARRPPPPPTLHPSPEGRTCRLSMQTTPDADDSPSAPGAPPPRAVKRTEGKYGATHPSHRLPVFVCAPKCVSVNAAKYLPLPCPLERYFHLFRNGGRSFSHTPEPCLKC